MEISGVKRLDHLGLVMGVIRELGIIELIDERIGQHDQHEVTPGEAVAAMILNGLGFVNRPLSLTPQFFENKALSHLFGREMTAEALNRHKLGRVLDETHGYGSEVLFSEIALSVAQKIKLNQQISSIDTTSFSLSGAYDHPADEHEITITHGYSKDHRPDLKQVVLELVTSQDGGIPLMMKSFDGNASDSNIFKERCEAFVAALSGGSAPQVVVGDSKLYHDGNIENLKKLYFITRIPGVYKAENTAISEALRENKWTDLDDKNKYHEVHLEHLGLAQRWFVVASTAAEERATKTVTRQVDREKEHAEKALKRLQNKGFACEDDARRHLADLSKTLKYHNILEDQVVCQNVYSAKGRPTKDTQPTHQNYTILGKIVFLEEAKSEEIRQKSCYVIGTNAPAEMLCGHEVIDAYKNQNASIERGFRFLKDPYFFASSFFLKKPARIMGLLMVMSLSLLVYTVAQRHLRQQLKKLDETLPNQIKKQVKNPTIRWVFQLLEGIDIVYTKTNDTSVEHLMGLTDLKKKVLTFFQEPVLKLYHLNLKNPQQT